MRHQTPTASSHPASPSAGTHAPCGEGDRSCVPSSSAAVTSPSDAAQRAAHAGGLTLRGHESAPTGPRRLEVFRCEVAGCDASILTEIAAGQLWHEHVHQALVAGWVMKAGVLWTGRCPSHREGR